MKSLLSIEKFSNYANLQSTILEQTDYKFSDFDLSGFIVPYFSFSDSDGFFHLCRMETIKIGKDKTDNGFAYFTFIDYNLSLMVKTSQFSEEGNESRIFKELCKIGEQEFFLFRFNGKKALLQEDSKGKMKDTGKTYNDFYLHRLKSDISKNPF